MRKEARRRGETWRKTFNPPPMAWVAQETLFQQTGPARWQAWNEKEEGQMKSYGLPPQVKREETRMEKTEEPPRQQEKEGHKEGLYKRNKAKKQRWKEVDNFLAKQRTERDKFFEKAPQDHGTGSGYRGALDPWTRKMFSPWEREPDHGRKGEPPTPRINDPDLLRAKAFAWRIMERKCLYYVFMKHYCKRKVRDGFHCKWHSERNPQDHAEKEGKPGEEHGEEDEDTPHPPPSSGLRGSRNTEEGSTS